MQIYNGVNCGGTKEKQLDYLYHIRNIEKLVTKSRKKNILHQVGYAYRDIGSSQAINATHVFAELWPMRFTISVIISDKEQRMNHFM